MFSIWGSEKRPEKPVVAVEIMFMGSGRPNPSAALLYCSVDAADAYVKSLDPDTLLIVRPEKIPCLILNKINTAFKDDKRVKPGSSHDYRVSLIFGPYDHVVTYVSQERVIDVLGKDLESLDDSSIFKHLITYKRKASRGVVTMFEDGTLSFQFKFNNADVGNPVCYSPDASNYDEVLSSVQPIEPGESKEFGPW